MRMLGYKVCTKVIEFLNYNKLYIIDTVNEVDEAVYYLNVRSYNLVLVFENDLKICIELLNQLPKNNRTAFVVLTENYSKDFELKLLKKGALDVIKNPFDSDLILARIEAIHRNNFTSNISISNKLFLDAKFKLAFDHRHNKISMEKKAFDILKYLAQHTNRRVTPEELIQVVWKEPEIVRNNLVEVHIYRLKKVLKQYFSSEIIDNKKRLGYKLI